MDELFPTNSKIITDHKTASRNYTLVTYLDTLSLEELKNYFFFAILPDIDLSYEIKTIAKELIEELAMKHPGKERNKKDSSAAHCYRVAINAYHLALHTSHAKEITLAALLHDIGKGDSKIANETLDKGKNETLTQKEIAQLKEHPAYSIQKIQAKLESKKDLSHQTCTFFTYVSKVIEKHHCFDQIHKSYPTSIVEKLVANCYSTSEKVEERTMEDCLYIATADRYDAALTRQDHQSVKNEPYMHSKCQLIERVRCYFENPDLYITVTRSEYVHAKNLVSDFILHSGNIIIPSYSISAHLPSL